MDKVSPTDKIVMIYVPCGSEEVAAGIITSLLEERLVACGNVLPSQSFYHAEGKIVNEGELILICKTTQGRAPAAQERIAQLHSYEIPCIITIETLSVNRAYAEWVLRQVNGDDDVPTPTMHGDRTEVIN
jgi:periplasmic divalent cation tolerance protein